MKEIGKMGRRMGKERKPIRMILGMMVITLTISLKGLGRIIGMIKKHMKAIGAMEFSMVKEKRHLLTEQSTMANGETACLMDKVSADMLIEVIIKANGEMVNLMVLARNKI
jgi:hypothetical protein